MTLTTVCYPVPKYNSTVHDEDSWVLAPEGQTRGYETDGRVEQFVGVSASMSGTFELRDHTADVAVEASGPTLESVFEALGEGLAAAMADDIPDSGARFDFEERAESRDALLFDYLDRLIYERDVREVLPVDHEVSVTETADGWTAVASARGVPLADVTAREVKAVTYSEMDLSRRDGGWHGYVVFDV